MQLSTHSTTTNTNVLYSVIYLFRNNIVFNLYYKYNIIIVTLGEIIFTYIYANIYKVYVLCVYEFSWRIISFIWCREWMSREGVGGRGLRDNSNLFSLPPTPPHTSLEIACLSGTCIYCMNSRESTVWPVISIFIFICASNVIYIYVCVCVCVCVLIYTYIHFSACSLT